MSRTWPIVKLGEVLEKSQESIVVDPDDKYKEVSVKLWGKGVILRRVAKGADIAASSRHVVQADQFILSRIDARHGAAGIVPRDLEGAVVSGDFPVFDVRSDRLLPAFLRWMSRTAAFVDRCRAASEGTTNRVRLKERRFLAQEIPLPPLEEQRWLVAKLDLLQERVEEAAACRAQSGRGGDRLLIAMAYRGDLNAETRSDLGWRRVRLGEIIRQVADEHVVASTRSYPNCGIYSYARGLFAKPSIEGLTTSAHKLNRIRSGQFIYSRLFAFEGAYSIVPAEFDGFYVSNEYPTFECDGSQVLPEFLGAYFKAPTAWQRVAAGSKGLGNRRQRVKPDRLLAHDLDLPPLAWQQQIVELTARLRLVAKPIGSTKNEIAALRPSILDRAFRGEL